MVPPVPTAQPEVGVENDTALKVALVPVTNGVQLAPLLVEMHRSPPVPAM